MSIDPVAFSTAYAPGAYAFSGSPSYASTSAGGFSYSPPLPGPAAQQAGMGWTANLGGNAGGQDSPEEGASEDEDGLAPLPGETNGRVKGKKADREIKRRSSKACKSLLSVRERVRAHEGRPDLCQATIVGRASANATEHRCPTGPSRLRGHVKTAPSTGSNAPSTGRRASAALRKATSKRSSRVYIGWKRSWATSSKATTREPRRF